MRKLRMLITLLLVSVCSWQSAWAQEEPQLVTVEVSYSEAGSLGLEILASLAQQGLDKSLTIVEKLKVSGNSPMNDDDWTILKSCSALKIIDLSGANITEIPNEQFQDYSHELLLEEVTLPSNLETIGNYAFNGLYNLKSINLPSSLITIGDGAFSDCRNLTTIGDDGWPANVRTIPYNCFNNCKELRGFTIPEGVTNIGPVAFCNCCYFTSSLPSSLIEIGYGAFSFNGLSASWEDNHLMENLDIVIPEGCSIEGNGGIFSGSKIKSITLPTNYYTHQYGLFANCDNLADVTFQSPTVVIDAQEVSNADNITLHVPSYLVDSYLLDPVWLKYKAIEGFSTDLVSDWKVQTVLNLNSNSRITGSANMFFTEDAMLKINGTTSQVFGDFTTSSNDKYWSYPQTLILSGCNDVTVTGDYKHRLRTLSGWYFLCLPFDFAVSDITIDDGKKFAIRYYDGASRASENAATGNWKDCADDAVIPAGTGFIFQTTAPFDLYTEIWTTFKAQANNTRNNVFKTEEIKISLNKYACENAANRNWNYIGNPWQTYYNIRKLNYTAPISVYGQYGYEAYSPQDDDYALRPNQGFFVQCPDALTEIGFPIDGRQLTSEITSQNGSRAATASNRKLFDLQIAAGELKDKTRLVINPQAAMDYEIGCDASKFMADGTDVAQIYSLGSNGTKYAINERPANDGSLSLGIVFAKDGQYILSAIRNDIGQVILTDLETGIKTDLNTNDYSFDAKAGTSEGRFMLTFGSGLTGISTIQSAISDGMEVYTLDGKKTGYSTDGLKKGVYVVRQGQKTQKVIIK